MRVFLAVLICKILYFIGSKMGRGSSLSGQIALKICPGVLKRLRLPKTIIAVTGSNGKTSTAELIARALTENGKSVGWNHEGSNQTEGIATLLLRIATFGGKVRRDALVLECDERYARYIFEDVKPSVVVVTNLCRDQLTRNGHPEFISDCIRNAIEAQSASAPACLVLNADDPYVSALVLTHRPPDTGRDAPALLYGVAGRIPLPTDIAFGAPDYINRNDVGRDALGAPDYGSLKEKSEKIAVGNRVVWFGVGSAVVDGPGRRGMYDDGAFCPVCKSRMTYEYRIAGHYGKYNCSRCGHYRNTPDIEVAGLDIQSGETAISFSGGSITTRLTLPSLTGAYNLAAAIAAAEAAGVSAQDAARALDGYELRGGRTIRFSAGAREGILLISKHENSLSYNQSMAWTVLQRKPCTVIVLVDAISRKYYTSETSWLWDIDFDILADDNVREVMLAGRYSNELMARAAMSAIPPEKCRSISDLSSLREYVGQSCADSVYAITCFSDKAKLLKAFE